MSDHRNKCRSDRSGPIENIVIVGGGTAGWIAANTLHRAVSSATTSRCKITLVESSNVPTVGVGEATLPTLPALFKYLEIPEREMMAECSATFKLAIKFANWSGLKNHAGEDVFWHPFGLKQYSHGDYVPEAHHWLKVKMQGEGATDYARDCFPEVIFCEQNKAPRKNTDSEYRSRAQYAYHLDAGKLAEYLKKRAIENGVVHVVDDVVDVSTDHEGYIDYIQCREHGRLNGDLYLDCSGFRGLLINQTLKEPFESYNRYLPCNKAVAMQVPHKEGTVIEPYTTSTAMSAGWIWNTPLTNRNGNGYVYSSEHTDSEAAELELRRHTGTLNSDLSARHLDMRVGKTRRSWVRNCISIGLSGGFIEPLESTGIYLIEAALEHLIHNLPSRRCESVLANNFNRRMDAHYEEIRDFLVLHYCITQREDTSFWQRCKHASEIPDKLQEQLDLWEHAWPNNKRPGLGPLFHDYSYVCILAGMQRWPVQSLPLLDHVDPMHSQALINHLQAKSSHMVESMPDQRTFLQQAMHDIPQDASVHVSDTNVAEAS